MAAESGHPDVWIVVRCFNEGSVVGDVVKELRGTFTNVIGVDDGSTDDSSQAMAQAGAWVVRHVVNLGPGAALQTGLQYALLDPLAQWFVCFDADGQHRVEDALAMVERVHVTPVDVLVGSRFLGQAPDMSLSRRFVLRVGGVFERFTSGIRLSDGHNGLRVMSRRFAELVDLHLPGMAYASELLSLMARSGLPYDEHPVTIDYTDYSRAKGQRSLNSINIAVDVWLSRLLRGGRS